jgi:hypothetical protein
MFPPYPATPLSPMPRGFPRGPASAARVAYPSLEQATLFDGVNDFAEVTGLGLGAPAEFTAMGWVRPDAVGTNRVLDTTAGVATNGLEIFILSSQFRFGSYGPTGTNTGAAFGPSLTASRRYHVAIVATGGNLLTYVDGAFVGTTAIPVGNRPDSLVRLRFGLATNGANPFSGALSAWSVYQRALALDEIVAAARGAAIHPNLDAIVAAYPFDRLAPTATQSPDIGPSARHLTLTNMPANPITTF